MEDIQDLVKNIDAVYSSDTSFQVLKDFERVLDQLDLYVYKNWEIFGVLFTCPLCFSQWVGDRVSSIICYALDGNWMVVPFAFFTYPVLIYFLIRKYIG